MIARIVRLDGPRNLAWTEEQLAAPGEGELMCETLVTAISPGTELAAYAGKAPLRPGNPYPRVQGYCNVARVTHSGDEGYSPGDRILSFTSHRDRFVLAAEDVLYRLPEAADAGMIACTYLYHLGYNAVLRSGVRPGSRVLVLGLGTLGLTSCTMSAIAGADLYGLSDQPRPAELALAMGARRVFRRDERAALIEALGPGADVVIATTDAWDDWHTALEAAAFNATIAVLSFPGRDTPPGEFNPLASRWLYDKQLRIEAVGMSPETADSRGFLRFNERSNIAWIARRIEEGSIDPSLIVSGRYQGMDIGRAYDDLLARKDSPVTYLLDWSR